MIYLDSAATTQVSAEVLDAMLPYLRGQYGNPNSPHQLGRLAADAVEKARGQVASAFGGTPGNIIFTSGGSEANALAIIGLSRELCNSGKKHIVASAGEHRSVLGALRRMQENGFSVSYIYSRESGDLSLNDIELVIRPATGLIVAMYVNNETGAVNDVEKIGEICRRYDVFFHSDCVQALGTQALTKPFTSASVSGHKIHAPKGVGALYMKDFTLYEPMIYGGAAQEFGVRGGTANVAGIVGFGKACEIAVRNQRRNAKQIYELCHSFICALSLAAAGTLSESGIYINGVPDGKILNLRINGVSGETLAMLLDTKGVCVSAGSACHAHDSEPSHALLAMGLPPDEARSSIRISFSENNTRQEVVDAAKTLAECIGVLREVGHE